ncbi:thiamine-phosphate pyrophosphorylase [Clostridium cavendishii DSM 21758]|uniref:Thiamine-phosphate pyrophosphorylase n=1 Tax=Clostridium cavendishii DSM 21758 TaxID=1121302 RepID=A0A1M6I7C5_9CLOT|nr:thiamine phosphate synthase [Clostridium cavendishii]SHJ30283.1 thiamine-phosphate pyrophosphorylase [Clostridium cavendishii DSM 21758]
MIYLITNRNLAIKEKYLAVLKEASYNGINNIILREKDLADIEFEELYRLVKKSINPKCNLIINSKLNVFNRVKENTIHLPFKEFLSYNPNRIVEVGVSVHTLEEGIEADKRGAKYILASHIYETKCKEGLEPKGIEYIRRLKNNVKCQIIALGGINEKNYKDVLNAGADGIALMSYFFKQDADYKKFNI